MAKKITKKTLLKAVEKLMAHPAVDLSSNAQIYIYYCFGKYGESYNTAFKALCHFYQIHKDVRCTEEEYLVTKEALDFAKAHFSPRPQNRLSFNKIYNHIPEEKTVRGNRVQLPLFQEQENV